MYKAEIRKKATKRRQGLSATEVQQRSEQLLHAFTRLDFTGIQVVHLFLPIESKNEPNTYLFIDWLKQHHPSIKVLVPRADFDTSLMTHHEYPGADALIRNAYQILEPENVNPHTENIDMVLIPLLAFDLQGYRVGYGKGFYDRFLQEHSTLKVGLSLFDAEQEPISDVDQYDVKMDLCLTPERCYKFD